MLHSYQGNAYWHFVVVFLIALISCYVSAEHGKCSANDNKYWNRKMKVCAICKECTHGQARNFSEKYTGPPGRRGDNGCLPCRRPPPGYYIRVLGTQAFFQLCGKKCAALFRHHQIPCGDCTDAVCGSCYAGYHGETNNADFACIKNIPPTTTTLTELTTIIVNETEPWSNDSMPTPDARDGALVLNDGNFLAVTMLAAVLSGGGLVFVNVAYVSLRRKRLQRKKLRDSLCDLPTDSRPGSTNIESCLFRIQSTAAYDRQTEKSEVVTQEHSRPIPPASHSHVDMSLGENPSDLTMDGLQRPTTTDCCRPELSMPMAVVTESHNALPLCINRPFSRSTECMICKCRERRQCDCKRLSEQYTNIKMLDIMSSIDIVARHICHDPKCFFQSLEVVNSKYYQTFVGIDKRELRAEYYREVLKEWVHIKGDQAFVSDLIEKLCEHNFHDICDLIAENMAGETHLKYKV